MMLFDIESAPIPEAATYLPPQQAPSNYKDAEKIAAYIAEAEARALDKAALDPGLLRIVAIGYQIDTDTPVAMLARDTDEERTILARFWRLATQQTQAGGELVGFNCIAFDLPALITRSWLLGVQPHFSQLKRYGNYGVIDLMDRLSFGGLLPARGLGWWCRRVGIGSDDTTTGAEMPQFVRDGNWEAVEGHVKADIAKTAALAAFCGVIRF